MFNVERSTPSPNQHSHTHPPMSWDYIMKFVIAGEAGTGKTSILYRLTDSKFLTTPDPTIGVEFGSKLLRVSPSSSEEDEGKWIKLQCWDVAGSPSFRSITKSYYRGAAGALLVFVRVLSSFSFIFRQTPLLSGDIVRM